MGFKEFCKNQEKINNYETSKNKQETAEQIFNKYKNKNQEDLMNELFKNVDKQKQNGNFDYKSLVCMAEKMSPFLSPEQKQNLEILLNKIK